MPRTTRTLLIILALVSVFAVWMTFDWSVPGKLVRNYQQTRASMPERAQHEEMVKSLRAEFGESVEISYTFSFDLEGKFSKTVQVLWYCDDNVDGLRFLRTAVSKLHDIGFGWPDHVEMLFKCGFAKPE